MNARSVRLIDRRTVAISALAVGLAVISAFVAKFLIALIGLITNVSFYQTFSTAFASPAGNHLGWGVVLVPVYGAVIVGIMARYGSRAIRGHGIPEAMEQVLLNQSRIPARLIFLKPLSAAIAIGTGGPFGAEGPIIATGAALGSVFGQLGPTTAHERKTLLGAGAAAGMTAIFNSPISAVILAIELLVFEFRPRSFVPICLAVATSAAVRTAILGSEPAFPMPDITTPLPASIFGYAVEGLLIGLASVAVTKMTYWVEDVFEELPIHWMWWPALGALVVGIIGYFAPRTLGVGYDNIAAILAHSMTTQAILFLCVMKFISWVIALSSGTSGGTLAPLFTIGGGIGLGLGVAFQALVPGLAVDPRVAALVGMAGLFAGASRALLASIVFAFETTRQPMALLPLLAGCTTAYLISAFRMRNTIMTEKIARRGVRVPDEYGADFLQQVSVGEAMTAAPSTLSADQTVAEILKRVEAGDVRLQHQGYPVVDATGHLCGVVTLKDLYRHRREGALPLQRIVGRPPITIGPEETLRAAVNLMTQEGVGRLMVADPLAPQRVLGILTRSDLLKSEKARVEEMNERQVTLRLRKGIWRTERSEENV